MWAGLRTSETRALHASGLTPHLIAGHVGSRRPPGRALATRLPRTTTRNIPPAILGPN